RVPVPRLHTIHVGGRHRLLARGSHSFPGLRRRPPWQPGRGSRRGGQRRSRRSILRVHTLSHRQSLVRRRPSRQLRLGRNLSLLRPQQRHLHGRPSLQFHSPRRQVADRRHRRPRRQHLLLPHHGPPIPRRHVALPKEKHNERIRGSIRSTSRHLNCFPGDLQLRE